MRLIYFTLSACSERLHLDFLLLVDRDVGAGFWLSSWREAA